jgi:dimethylhistidine N-methyltransferase
MSAWPAPARRANIRASMPSPTFLQAPQAQPTDAAAEIAAGLRRAPAALSPKFFYDRLGSRLFDAITELAEYYPTRTEATIFAHETAAIADAIGAGATLVDLGAGNCAKAAALLPALRAARYVAVDISTAYLREALDALHAAQPGLAITGVGMDFSSSPRLPEGVLQPGDRPWFFYPGSSIGNFTPAEALGFLRTLHAQAAGGGLLIGVDLVKDPAVLEAAYDDELGVTAAFNLNLLRHVNHVLGCDFRPRDWKHVAFFAPSLARIEMHLEARQAVTVSWPGGERRFAAGERLHTENSYKYTVAGFEALLRDAGFQRPRCFTDARGWFALFLARP